MKRPIFALFAFFTPVASLLSLIGSSCLDGGVPIGLDCCSKELLVGTTNFNIGDARSKGHICRCKAIVAYNRTFACKSA